MNEFFSYDRGSEYMGKNDQWFFEDFLETNVMQYEKFNEITTPITGNFFQLFQLPATKFTN